MKDNSGKILLALLAGASAGVVAGLLMAPDTGEVTRTSVKSWANKVSKDLEKNLQVGLDEIKTRSNEAMSKMSSAAKEATDAVKEKTGKSSDTSASGDNA
ncbi:YtxH domain-containing protein [Pontibacter silvestris]|uniref:YtxH domain-containing protein n=1 Tax=Pontibacter silvestris TaxID=2305183 RepID=A0ABW4WUN4_9BACT|nr:YtxH domain-containing protein [Pontibacter silvestris]MCC9138064.1 YtxH domain-containing protein [Pontibacter silvestris]